MPSNGDGVERGPCRVLIRVRHRSQLHAEWFHQAATRQLLTDGPHPYRLYGLGAGQHDGRMPRSPCRGPQPEHSRGLWSWLVQHSPQRRGRAEDPSGHRQHSCSNRRDSTGPDHQRHADVRGWHSDCTGLQRRAARGSCNGSHADHECWDHNVGRCDAHERVGAGDRRRVHHSDHHRDVEPNNLADNHHNSHFDRDNHRYLYGDHLCDVNSGSRRARVRHVPVIGVYNHGQMSGANRVSESGACGLPCWWHPAADRDMPVARRNAYWYSSPALCGLQPDCADSAEPRSGRVCLSDFHNWFSRLHH